MCGIVGITSKQGVAQNLVHDLKRLEYRGYDSAGFCTLEKRPHLIKDIGYITDVVNPDNIAQLHGTIGLAHTRWATTGKVTKENAHPHGDCTNTIFIVHNGIISNYKELKDSLLQKGHLFQSMTDSEVIAHYFEEETKTQPIEETIQQFFREAEGEFAILLVRMNDPNIYALKKDSPLVLGVGTGENTLASDVYAFSTHTQKAIYFDDREYAVISPDHYEFFSAEGKPIKKEVKSIESRTEELKDVWDHYMLKEIKEQPKMVQNLLHSLRNEQKANVSVFAETMRNHKRIYAIGCGTAYFATLLGSYVLSKVGIDLRCAISSEFENYPIDSQTLVIAISQSGETMDTIKALKRAKEQGATIASLVNTPYSTIDRMSNVSLDIRAGQEICVAATKSFTNQVVTMLVLAEQFGFHDELAELPHLIHQLFETQEERIKKLAQDLKDKPDLYIIGRNLTYPVSREIALKVKEIDYIHAEGMMGGELKHGSLTLIQEGTPVLALLNGSTDIVANAKEVEARGGRIIAFTNRADHLFSEEVIIPTHGPVFFALLCVIAGQLLAYYIGKEKELPIDKPRNIAKSCTTV